MKRSERYSKSKRKAVAYDDVGPHYNTYYQPVGRPPKKKKGKRWFLTILLLLAIVVAVFMGLMYFLSRSANVEALHSIEQKDSYVPVSDMNDYTKGAFIAIEDERFYNHHGFDIKGTSRALFSTVSEQSVQGGSTITQQVVKNYFYGNERSFIRKMKELFVAYRVESVYDKDQILSFYVNNIYFGDDQYTVESAANYYFGTTTDKNNKHLPQISVLQSAMLASKINAPSVYNLNQMSDRYINRVKVNLEKMKQQDFISNDEYEEAISQLGAS
ncbi:monofunctional peptidoglycan glycosyltransferase SgtB [Staphylococcus auricularis]|uniref:monofunctional peptidoglycan glycosyltransferase SgtB n=1 Tax=Staphylococcus auricularis TaxID=29379 RepID=UPI002DB58476|nr:monofunctional peptidoglycan glycosyltransferase SgtB [Staphylococcus auricularis]MEB6570850.1 monofunctional peptidoglycan glycosyltransferase SgtB [Staphylococcus auricularis]